MAEYSDGFKIPIRQTPGMNMKPLAAVTLALLLAACASVSQPVPPTPAPDTAFATPDQEIAYRVFMGELAFQRGADPVAVQQYARAAQLSHDPSLLRQALTLAYQSGDNNVAWQLDQRWLMLAPTDRDALRFQAVLDARLDRPADAAWHFEQMLSAAHGDSYLSVAMLLGQETDVQHGLPVMQRMVEAAPDSAEAHYAYAELAMHYRRAVLAETEARKALDIRPAFDSARLLLARALEGQGKYDAALALIRPRVAARPGDVSLWLAYAALLAQAGRNTEAETEFETVLKRQPLNARALYSLGLLALSENKYSLAHDYFLRLYHSGRETDAATYFLGNVAELQQEYPRALDWYHRVTQGERWLPAQIAITRVLLANGTPATARRFMDEVVATDAGDAPQLRAGEAQLFSDRGDPGAARAVLDEALTEFPGNDDLLYARALLEESTGNAVAAEHDLQQIIRQSPENASALNALGYTLTLHSRRFTEALGYIQQALTLTPDDPAIMDSMGWVQYRLGHTALALKYLQQAYALQEDPEIAAHLVEVLLAAGDRQQAYTLWQRASHAHPDAPELKRLSARIKP